MFVLALMMASRNHYSVVFEAASEAEATLACNYLCGCELTAVVIEGQMPGFFGISTRVAQVVVPLEQADRAAELLAEHAALLAAQAKTGRPRG
jgi:hypothetical protein